jgi:AcrR family transcriptional regulator
MDALTKPKRRNAPRTKARILAAAQQAFAELGYAQAGIREIAAIAGVSSTLLIRYYGSKSGLFEAALSEAVPLDGLLGATERRRFGEHLAALILETRADLRPPSMVALSTGDAEARRISTRVTEQRVLKPLAAWLGPPDARARATQIIMLGMGFVLYTRELPLVSTVKGMDRKLARWFARSVQEIVDQSAPSRANP